MNKSFIDSLNKALESAANKTPLYIEQLQVGVSPYFRQIHSVLKENNRGSAFDILFNVTNDIYKRDYIESVLCAGRFLLSNRLIEECYIFLSICQEKIIEVYGEPIDYLLLEEIGNMFYLAGLCGDAIKWYEKLMEMNEAPESRMYFNIAMCLQVMEQYDKAIENYVKSTYADPRFYKSWVNLGYCYIKVGKPSKAVLAFQQLPLSAESLLCLGNAHFNSGNYEEAVAFFLRSIEFKEDAGTYNNLGIALKKIGLFQDSIYAFTNSLSIKPNTEASCNLLTLYIELGKKHDAQQLLKTCQHLIPHDELKELQKLYETHLFVRQNSIAPGNTAQIFMGLVRRNTISRVTSPNKLK